MAPDRDSDVRREEGAFTGPFSFVQDRAWRTISQGAIPHEMRLLADHLGLKGEGRQRRRVDISATLLDSDDCL